MPLLKWLRGKSLRPRCQLTCWKIILCRRLSSKWSGLYKWSKGKCILGKPKAISGYSSVYKYRIHFQTRTQIRHHCAANYMGRGTHCQLSRMSLLFAHFINNFEPQTQWSYIQWAKTPWTSEEYTNIQYNQLSNFQTNYSNAVINNLNCSPNSNKSNISEIITLLTYLITVLALGQNKKTVLTATNSFISILTTLN